MSPRDRFDSLIQYHVERTLKAAIDWRYVKALLDVESAMDPKAISKAGAEGLCQAMPATWGDVMPLDSSPFNPEHAIDFCCRYLATLLRTFMGDRTKATAGYNAGPGRVREAIAKGGDGWFLRLPPETRAYVPRVAQRFDALRRDA